MEPLPVIDVSIVLFNSKEHLSSLINSLVEQSYPTQKIALYISDNDSQDESIVLCDRLIKPYQYKFNKISISQNKQNIGFGRAHNALLKQGEGKYIFILNPDCILTRDCIEVLASAAEVDSIDVAAWEARQAPYEHPKNYDPLTLETSWCSAAALFVRRESFELVDGFDPKLFLYAEDVDFSWRLRQREKKLRYIPKAVVYHNTYQFPGECKPVQFLGSTRNNLMLRSRYGSWRDIFKGYLQYIALMLPFSSKPIRGHRLHIFRGLVRSVLNFTYFRYCNHVSSKRAVADSEFYGWDYHLNRDGAFFDITTGLEQTEHPKISVLIRTIGRRNLLKDALLSLQQQTYPNIEVVIVEDGAATVGDIGDKFPKLDVQYKSLLKNVGRCQAGNMAMEMAKGEYFIFLDEDDLFYPDHLEQLMGGIQLYKGKVAYSYAFELPTDIDETDWTIKSQGQPYTVFRQEFSFIKLLENNYIPIHTALFHRSLFEECGGLDPEHELLEDWNLFVRFALQARPFVTVPKTTALYRVPMGGQLAQKRNLQLQDALYYRKKRHASLPINAITIHDLLDLVNATRQSNKYSFQKILHYLKRYLRDF